MIYLIVFLTALFEGTLLDLIAVGNVKPDILLIIVVFVASYKDLLKAVTVGILAGFLKDILSAGAFLNILVFGVCSIAVNLFANRFYFYKEKSLAQFLAVSIISAVTFCVYLLWFLEQGWTVSIVMLAVWVGIPTVFYTTLAAPFMFFILKRCKI